MNQQRIRASITLCLMACLCMTALADATALDDYVAASDSHFAFSQVGSASFDSSTYTDGYTVDLTSQAWLTSAEVDTPVWRHWMTVIVPRYYLFAPPLKDTALLLIDGGDTVDAPPAFDAQLRQLAAATRTVIVRLSAVPNQPLQFTDEVSPRSEDEIIAYSWDKYLNSQNPKWPVQLPMVKSVVRAMDATQSFVSSEAGHRVNRFVLVGGSKRGWTAWLTAAVDSRVRAICPIVSDLLNMPVSFPHHWAAYGFWAEALGPYEDLGIFDLLDTDAGAELMRIVDPYSYRDQLTMPKFIINAAGDDFFVSDTARFYIHDLPGETYLRHVPNSNHYLTGTYDDIVSSMVPYYDALLNGYQRPRFTWTVQDNGSILVQTTDRPKSVRLWQATNPSARDFRQTTIGATWTSSVLSDIGSGVYIGQVPQPATGWVAYFVELTYSNPFSAEYSSTSGEFDYRFTTEMRVLPKTMPHPGAMIAPVHRFWSEMGGHHFYTINPLDKIDLIQLGSYWGYEQIGFFTYLSDCDEALRPVYRFWSDVLGGHFYTISETERDYVLANYPSSTWAYEGIAFYAYPPDQQLIGTKPVHRFWSDVLGSHFYTISEAEKAYVIATYPTAWTYEGIAWYAISDDD